MLEILFSRPGPSIHLQSSNSMSGQTPFSRTVTWGDLHHRGDLHHSYETKNIIG